MFLGLCIYSRTRNEKLVDFLYEHGLSISYDRVLDIHNAIGDFVVERFVQNGVVCPLSIKRGVFTTVVVDNVDHNPTATSSKTSFHGTSISLFQHSPNNGIEQEKLVVPTGEKKNNLQNTNPLHLNTTVHYQKLISKVCIRHMLLFGRHLLFL